MFMLLVNSSVTSQLVTRQLVTRQARHDQLLVMTSWSVTSYFFQNRHDELTSDESFFGSSSWRVDQWRPRFFGLVIKMTSWLVKLVKKKFSFFILNALLQSVNHYFWRVCQVSTVSQCSIVQTSWSWGFKINLSLTNDTCCFDSFQLL